LAPSTDSTVVASISSYSPSFDSRPDLWAKDCGSVLG
jgi:hypothetical protein